MDTYRLTVSITVGKGSYGYDRICDHEFQISGPINVLEQLDLAPSVKHLVAVALAEIDTEPEGED